MDSDFPARTKPWTWQVSPSGETSRIFDARGNVLLTVQDEHLDRERDVEEIVKCVNEQEQLKARVKELEQENQQLKLAVQQETPIHPPQITGNDQELKKELERKIVRLELYRFEFQHITEQIGEIDTYANYLKKSGQPLPRAEKERRKELSGAWLAKAEAFQKEFPHAIAPLFIQEEMVTYCQTLVDINERLKSPVQPQQTSYYDQYRQITERHQGQQQNHEQDRNR